MSTSSRKRCLFFRGGGERHSGMTERPHGRRGASLFRTPVGGRFRYGGIPDPGSSWGIFHDFFLFLLEKRLNQIQIIRNLVSE